MPYGEVTLVPGVNTEKTPTKLQAGISQSQLIRFRDSLAQKYGGWQKYYGLPVSGVPRDMHAWEDLNQASHLGVGTTTQLAVITSGSLQNITPQTLTSDFAPNFTTVQNTATVEIVDPNISNVTTYDSVFFNTPVSVGGIILSGLYSITTITGTHSYKITAATNATSGVSNGGAVPQFTTTSGSALVQVTLTANGLSSTQSNTITFPISTTGNGVTISGTYTVPTNQIIDANNFNITVAQQATASSSFFMNSSNAELVYYIQLGPPAAGAGYGTGGYGAGGYGTGTTGSSQTGTAITATDWTQDNWGEILLSCPTTGGVYQFDPTSGFVNAGLVATAPPFNGGIFVSIGQQILFCWGSTQADTIGVHRDPLLIKWSNSGDYTNFVPQVYNQAGSFRIPIGSTLMAGAAVMNQNLFWTDLDLWAANYLGPPFVFGFNKLAAGAGAISSHAVQQLRGSVFWMGASNFYVMSANGVSVLPCSVWDFVFQNLNTTYQANVRAMPNTPFNEVGWEFPSSASSNGENDSYVKFNITEPNQPWDYGPAGSMPRSAWIDQTVLGPPLGASPSGIVYKQETTNDADGVPLMSSFTTGYFYLGEGEDYCIVDQVIPDMKWGTYSGAQGANVQLTFNVVNYPGDTVTSYGPYVVTTSTEYISTRFRGRQMSITVASSDLGSFWRLGKIRYRYSQDGRR
jgi:hypothetical protein